MFSKISVGDCSHPHSSSSLISLSPAPSPLLSLSHFLPSTPSISALSLSISPSPQFSPALSQSLSFSEISPNRISTSAFYLPLFRLSQFPLPPQIPLHFLSGNRSSLSHSLSPSISLPLSRNCIPCPQISKGIIKGNKVIEHCKVMDKYFLK